MTNLHHARPVFRFAVRAWTLLSLAAVVGLLCSGCAQRFPSEQIPKMKWLILPFTPKEKVEDTMTINGWWLGARTIRQNERAGDMIADTLSRQMAHLDFLNLFSSIDIKYYFANKTRRLKAAYSNLSDEEVAQAMAKVPKLEFAKDLGADKLLTGTINRHYMGENRTIHWWWSVLDVDVQVTNVATGKVEWSHNYVVRRQSASMAAVQEEFANRLIEDLKGEYFLPLIKK